jgi:hypothetical protein
MFRYYMTPETRQAVIAESNRLIAERAALNAARKHRETGRADEPFEAERFPSQGAVSSSDFSDSAFARLVSDLQLTALRTASRPAPSPGRP